MTNLLTIKEVTQILRVSERTIYRYIKAGELKAIKIGGWRFQEEDLDFFISKKGSKSNNK